MSAPAAADGHGSAAADQAWAAAARASLADTDASLAARFDAQGWEVDLIIRLPIYMYSSTS